MTTPQSDEELGRLFRAKADSLGCSPAVLMGLAEAIATFQTWSVMPNFPPFPNIDLEEILGPEHLAAWPEWTAKVISPGWPNC